MIQIEEECQIDAFNEGTNECKPFLEIRLIEFEEEQTSEENTTINNIEAPNSRLTVNEDEISDENDKNHLDNQTEMKRNEQNHNSNTTDCNVKQHACEQCDERFATAQALGRHSRTHTGIPMFETFELCTTRMNSISIFR